MPSSGSGHRPPVVAPERLSAWLRTGCAVAGDAFAVLRVTGKDGLDLLHRLSTNALNRLRSGEARETVFTSEKGRIVDRAVVVVTESGILLVASRDAGERLLPWIKKFIIMEEAGVSPAGMDLEAAVLVGPVAAMAPAGPSSAVLTSGERGVAAALPEGGPLRGVILTPTAQRDSRMKELAAALPVLEGSDAECARIAFGVPAAGHELTEEFTPYDAGLRHAISFTKGCYIGQEVIARLDTYQKIQRHLAGIVIPDAAGVHAPARLSAAGSDAGVLTSFCRTGRGAVGLAVVRTGSGEGETLQISLAGGTSTPAHLTPLPLSPDLVAQLERQ